MLITVADGFKKYSEKIILDNAFLSIEDHDKIGIIGVNGTGKSTFLKILAGVEPIDSGKVLKKNGLKLNYLPQEPTFDESKSVLDIVKDYLLVEDRENKEHEAKSILSKLGITNYDTTLVNMSGGQRKRVGLACALVKPSEVLILDEPTNHLDNDMIVWLEKYLMKFHGSIIMVTHDRYFLERVCNRMVELERGQVYTYDVNYSNFLEAKAKREEYDKAVYQKNKNILRHELEWIRAGVQARGTKSKERISRYENLAAATNLIEKQNVDLSSMSTRLGKKTIELKNISKSFDDVLLIKDFTYIVDRFDRLGIIGNNGAGKTTLLNIMAQNILPDSGSVEVGETVKIGYFSQLAPEMDPKEKVIDYIRNISDLIQTKDGSISASSMLERFLFPKEMHYMTIYHLSGGEKRRLYLLSVLMEQPNILFLDEPTNDLDIETLSVLEDFLEEFNGAVIVVSHDRYFLDRVVDHSFVYMNNGEIKEFIGGYSYYIEKLNEANSEYRSSNKTEAKMRVQEVVRMSSKDKQRLAECEKQMNLLHTSIKEINEQMNTTEDFNLINELSSKRSELESKLEEYEMEWMELSEKQEEINAARKVDTLLKIK